MRDCRPELPFAEMRIVMVYQQRFHLLRHTACDHGLACRGILLCRQAVRRYKIEHPRFIRCYRKVVRASCKEFHRFYLRRTAPPIGIHGKLYLFIGHAFEPVCARTHEHLIRIRLSYREIQAV